MWLIDVTAKVAAFSQRYIISGSDRADGTYPADVGTPQIQVSGEEWTLTLQWNNNAGSGWQPSRVIRRNVNFTVEDGLVLELGADDNWVQIADNDFDDVVLRCQNIDPHLIPWHPYRRTLDFSLPRRRGGDDQTGGKDRPKEKDGEKSAGDRPPVLGYDDRKCRS
jgi:hypothetical protein